MCHEGCHNGGLRINFDRLVFFNAQFVDSRTFVHFALIGLRPPQPGNKPVLNSATIKNVYHCA